MSIPKRIHYCWFGGNPLPELAKKCIASWKKYCPDYEIVEWNENNFDINYCDYVKEAYAAKKWAFVSDVARFKILYENGGIYFDTDVELVSSIDDIVEKGNFMACEQVENVCHKINVAPGLGLGAEPNLKIYQEILNFYEKRCFVREDGTYDTTTIVTYTTDILTKHGLRETTEIQCIDSIFIYPADYFCPMNYWTGEIVRTENTRSIHHYSETWLSNKEKKYGSFKKWCNKRNLIFVERVLGFPFRMLIKVERVGIRKTLLHIVDLLNGRLN